MKKVTWLRTCPRCMLWMAPTARSIGAQAAHRRIARGVIARANPGTMMKRPKTPFLAEPFQWHPGSCLQVWRSSSRIPGSLGRS